MARIFKFKESIFGLGIHTFMESVNSRHNKEIYINGNKVKQNSMSVDDLIFICVNGDLLYSCRAASNGPYDNNGQTVIHVKDITRLQNPVRWSNYPELSNVAGPAWTKISDEQVDFINRLQPAQEIRMDLEEEVEEVVNLQMNIDEEVEDLEMDIEEEEEEEEDGEEFFGTLLQRDQINDIRQHIIMREMSQFRDAMGKRMRELNKMSDRDILNFTINKHYF
jgi:hypothetical protein